MSPKTMSELSEEAATERAALIRLELRRKTFHLLILLYLGAYWLIGEPQIRPVAAFWTALVVTVEISRLKIRAVGDLFRRVFGPIIREKEADRFTGAFYSSLGILTVFYIFQGRPTVVAAALLYLAFADSASALFGRIWGGHFYKLRGEIRSLEGSAAGFLAALACGLAVGLGPPRALLGALVFTAVDAAPIPPDDNFWIPVLTGAALAISGIR